MTWTPDLGLLIASNVSDMGLFEGDNDTTVKLVSPSGGTLYWLDAKLYTLSQLLPPSGPGPRCPSFSKRRTLC